MPYVEEASFSFGKLVSSTQSHVQKRFLKAYCRKGAVGEGGGHKSYYHVSIFAEDFCNLWHAGVEKIRNQIHVE